MEDTILDIATTLLIPSIRASKTEADAMVDAIEIKNETCLDES